MRWWISKFPQINVFWTFHESPICKARTRAQQRRTNIWQIPQSIMSICFHFQFSDDVTLSFSLLVNSSIRALWQEMSCMGFRPAVSCVCKINPIHLRLRLRAGLIDNVLGALVLEEDRIHLELSHCCVLTEKAHITCSLQSIIRKWVHGSGIHNVPECVYFLVLISSV